MAGDHHPPEKDRSPVPRALNPWRMGVGMGEGEGGCCSDMSPGEAFVFETSKGLRTNEYFRPSSIGSQKAGQLVSKSHRRA